MSSASKSITANIVTVVDEAGNKKITTPSYDAICKVAATGKSFVVSDPMAVADAAAAALERAPERDPTNLWDQADAAGGFFLRAECDGSEVEFNDSAYRCIDAGRPDPAQIEPSISQLTYDSKGSELREVHDDRVLTGTTGMVLGGTIKYPALVAANKPQHDEKCFCCGKPAWVHQQFTHVYATACASTQGTPEEKKAKGLESVRTMVQMLASAEGKEEVMRRIAVCSDHDCLIKQHVETIGFRWDYLHGKGNQQESHERPSESNKQDEVFRANIQLLRNMRFDAGLVNGVQQQLTPAELELAMQHLTLRANWVKVRECKYIATALCIVDHPRKFGYEFRDPQSFVNRMAGFIPAYCNSVLYELLCNDEFPNEGKWTAALNTHVGEKLTPLAPDVAFALVCEDNSKQWIRDNEPLRDADGRREHRVDASLVNPELFTPEGFEKALKECGHGVNYKLKYANDKSVRYQNSSVASASIANACGGSLKVHERKEIERGIDGSSNRRVDQDANPAIGMPACGRVKKHQNCHPHKRYTNIVVALGCAREEATDIVAMFLQHQPPGNTVGLQKVSATSSTSSETWTIREPLGKPVEPVQPSGNAPVALQATQKAALHTAFSKSRCGAESMVALGARLREKRAARQGEAQSPRTLKTGSATFIGFCGSTSSLSAVEHATQVAAGHTEKMTVAGKSILSTIDAMERSQPNGELEYGLPTLSDASIQQLVSANPAAASEPSVKTTSDANVALNLFSSQYGHRHIIANSHRAENRIDAYDATTNESFARAQDIHAAMLTLRTARRSANVVVRSLMARYNDIELQCLGFCNAHEQKQNPNVPETLKRTSLRTVAVGSSDEVSQSVKLARKQASENAEAQWLKYQPEFVKHNIEISKEKFLEIGQDRAWAIQKIDRACLLLEFAKEEKYKSFAEFSDKRRIDIEKLLDPEFRDRKHFGQKLEDQLVGKHQLTNEQIARIKDNNAKNETANTKRAEALEKKAQNQREGKRKAAEEGGPVPTQARKPGGKAKVRHVDEGYEEKAKAVTASKQTKYLADLAEIERFVKGDTDTSFEPMWRAFLAERYGGVAKAHMQAREMQKTRLHDSGIDAARRRAAEKLSGVVDERADGESALETSALMPEIAGDEVQSQLDAMSEADTNQKQIDDAPCEYGVGDFRDEEQMKADKMAKKRAAEDDDEDEAKPRNGKKRSVDGGLLYSQRVLPRWG